MNPPRLIVDNPGRLAMPPTSERTWSRDRNIMSRASGAVRVDRVADPHSDYDRTLYEARMADAYALGLQAYIWGWPMVEAARLRSAFLNPTFRHFAPINALHHEWAPADAGFTLLPSPCSDHLYSEGFFDVTHEPMVLQTPDTRGIRYWTAQICDFFTETVANISNRTIGQGPGDYVLVGPNWHGTLPVGVQPIHVPQNVGFILVQLRCDSIEDLALRVRPAQQRFKLTPLSCLERGTTWRPRTLSATDWRRRVPRTENDLHTTLAFFQILNRALTEARPRPGEEGMVALFNRIGVGAHREFDPTALDSATESALSHAVQDGWSLVRSRAMTTQNATINGWSTSNADAAVGAWGGDTLQRAGCAHRGIFSNVPAECIVISANTDSMGEPLNGSHRYSFRFSGENFPRVDSYWSLTAYSLPSRRLQFNPANRVVDSVMSNLRYCADGSLDICVQHEAPGGDKETNWLPVPEGAFEIVLRLYNAADPNAYFGAYAPGAVRRSSHLRAVEA